MNMARNGRVHALDQSREQTAEPIFFQASRLIRSLISAQTRTPNQIAHIF